MKFAYAILAHTAPEQLSRLIDRLAEDPEDDRIVLHLDCKSELWRNQRDSFAGHPSGKVVLVPDPVNVFWAHSSQVAAQCRILGKALECDFDYIHLISGADWPTSPREKIVADITAHGELFPAFADIYGEMQQERLQDWWFDDRKFRLEGFPRLSENIERAQTRLSWAFSRWWHKAGLNRGRYLDQPWVKGSGWFSLPRDIAADICREVGRMLDRGRMRFTQCPDEHAIQTVLMRRHGDRVVPDRRYIDWSAGGNHPKLLTSQDREAIIASGAWFARKFSVKADAFFLEPGAFSVPARKPVNALQD
ncbi:MAG: beta-1,6-N-acetylglucosaminyltransferase [Novosphingobium sp.]|nr:hypothetical protein [Novosphingobium sp.]MCB2077119.1 hypothetical protein [Novosphingobium sp.]